MLEQAGISLKGLNIDKLKAEYQELTAQKNELTATYKNCEKEVKSLNRKLKPEPILRTDRSTEKHTTTSD